jgi:acetyl-CoA C-acetyltransferase
MRDVVIIGAARTPMGRFLGALRSVPAPQLGALAVRAALERSGLPVSQIDEVLMGCVLQAGLGQNPARQAALAAGLPSTVSAMTVNMVCGSGLKSVMLATQAIQLGDHEVVIAGGMESMSNAPHLLPHARDGYRLGDRMIRDSLLRDGLWCAIDDWHMGETAELVAERWGISREAQDRYAEQSQRRAAIALQEGRFREEISPVPVTTREGKTVLVEVDEGPRPETSFESLARLLPAFRDGGTVTAGNAATINDGAAAVTLTHRGLAETMAIPILARVVAQAVSGTEPELVMMAPVEAIQRVLQKARWTADEVDLFEINEAFSAQSVALLQELSLDPARVNVNGGAVALGHPIGASGARILVTLVHELRRQNLSRGIAALCLGGGNAVALAVERERT